MSESDGMEDALEGISRIGLTVAARVGEQLARAYETAQRHAQAAEEQQGRELQARLDAERAAARAQLAPVMDNRWWDSASGRDIERVHETATAWKDHDPQARGAADTIKDQVQTRYGLDVNNLGVDESSVAMALAKSERYREQADNERGTSAAEITQTMQLLAEADRYDRDSQQPNDPENDHPETLREEADVKYDSAERRQELASNLDGIADKEAVEARMSADQDQGTPPIAAITKAAGKAPKARKTHGAGGLATLMKRSMNR